MKAALVVVITIFVLLFVIYSQLGGEGRGVDTSRTSGTSNTNTERIGESSVYERIERLTDCNKLQDEFDIAMDNVERLAPGNWQRDISFSYARFADRRMEEAGCYR